MGSRYHLHIALATVVLIGVSVPTLATLFAQTPTVPTVRVYTVTDASTFPALPGGKVLIFINGLFQSPGTDYTTKGATVVFRVGLLRNGDQIEVATLP
jgi:hypothetical protein